MTTPQDPRRAILETYSEAAKRDHAELCCSVNYRTEFAAAELDHIPAEVLQKNFGCGVPERLRTLQRGESVLDLGPGLGRDCFIASRKVGPIGRVYGVDMNPDMLERARSHAVTVAATLGYANVEFLEGRFDEHIPLPDGAVDVIFSNCVANLAVNKTKAYAEMFRVLKSGAMLSFSDVVSDIAVPQIVQDNAQAYADCIGGVQSFQELRDTLTQAGFVGVTLNVDFRYATGRDILNRYFSGGLALSDTDRNAVLGCSYLSVNIAAIKHKYSASEPDTMKGHRAIYHGPAAGITLDDATRTTMQAGEWMNVGEKTAWLLGQPPYAQQITVVAPDGSVSTGSSYSPGCC